MKKKLLNSMRVLLVAAGLCVGASAWATDVSFTAQTRGTLSEGTFTTDATWSGSSKYALALADLSDITGITDDNKAVIIEFDFNITNDDGARWHIGIGDKTTRGTTAGSSSGSTYDKTGIIGYFGLNKINNVVQFQVASTGYGTSHLGVTIHAKFTLNKRTSTYSLVLHNSSTDTDIYNQSGLSTTVSDATIIEVYSSTYGNKTISLSDVTVTVKNTYAYTVNAVDGSGNVLKTLASGSVVEGESVSAFYYPQNILVGNTLYQIDKNSSKPYFATTFTPNADNYSKNLPYTNATVQNVVYCSEGESIDGFTATNFTNTSSYASNGYAGYTSNSADKYVDLFTLPAGKYIFYARGINGNGTARNCYFKVGDDVAWTFIIPKNTDNGTYGVTDDSGEITVSTASTLSVSCYASSAGGLDWFYIKSISDNEFVGAVDYSTAWKAATTTPVTLKPGDSYHYQFVNYSQATVNDQNWQLIVANEANTADVMEIRADWWENLNGDPAEGQWQTYQRGFSSNAANYWDNVPSKMNGAKVDMSVTFTTDKKFTMSSTTTAADGETSWTYNYTSDNDNNIDLTDNAALTVYLTVALNWLEILSEAQTAVGVTTTAAGKGWATLYTDKGLDFFGVEGLTAYTATLSGTTVTLNAVDDIQAETGVVLKSTSTGATTIYSVPVTTASTTDKGSLIGSTTEDLTYSESDTNSYYMLALNNYDEAQFSKLTSGSIAAGKAYLVVAGRNDARSLKVMFADEATGISGIQGVTRADGQTYNLNGQRVAAPQKGLYIINGKKVIVK